MNYGLAFLLSFAISLTLTPIIRRLAVRLDAMALPDSFRKFHDSPTPQLGGVVILIAFLVPFLLHFSLDRRLLGLLAGIIILFVVGLVDDVRGLSPWSKLAGQIMAALAVLAGGIGIVAVTNPLGGQIALGEWVIPMQVLGWEFNILPIANAVTIGWILLVVNAMNLIDGLDGLATGVASIAATVLFVLAFTPLVPSIAVALLAVILLGALLGFLPYNFFPSSIFLGDSGAYVVGLLLAVLSVYAGSKISVGAIVLGFAIFDIAWTVARRVWQGKSPFRADRNHLHYILFDRGLSHRQTVLFLYTLTAVVAAIILIGNGFVAFAVLLGLLAGLAVFVKLVLGKYEQVED